MRLSKLLAAAVLTAALPTLALAQNAPAAPAPAPTVSAPPPMTIAPSGDIVLHHRKINELDIALDLYSFGDRLRPGYNRSIDNRVFGDVCQGPVPFIG